MSTRGSTAARKTQARRSWLWVAVVGAVIVAVAAAAVGIWALTTSRPVAAEDAQIEVTFTGDEASYAGDTEVIEGTANVAFVNDTDRSAYAVVLRFETGSTELDAELATIPEGSDVVTAAGHGGATVLMEGISPGSTQTWEVPLEPGTYVFDAAKGIGQETHVWRVAVIEVVAE
jgi:hypothetical protein